MTEKTDSDERTIDLHTHSTASDGSYTPTEIIHKSRGSLAFRRWLSQTMTHTSGLDEFISAANNGSIAAVPGPWNFQRASITRKSISWASS